MALVEVRCRGCQGTKVRKAGFTAKGKQRYLCQNSDCSTVTFLLDYSYRACEPGVREQILEMAMNGSGMRDTARVLKIDKDTVSAVLKKEARTSAQSTSLS